MQKSSLLQSGFVKPRALLAFAIALIGIGMAAFSFGAPASGVWQVAFSPAFLTDMHLHGVTCTSASDCWTVGWYYDGSGNGIAYPMAEHWNGTEWSIFGLPRTSDTQSNQVGSVACTSATDCWAVGENYTVGTSDAIQTLIEHWDGTAWAIVASPNTSATQTNQLFGVACASTADCWAVGEFFSLSAGSVAQTLIEHWDGNAWTIVTSPNTSATQKNLFEGVTCVSASDCWAVGAYYNGDGNRQTLTAHWGGAAWTIVSSPSTSATEHNLLTSVACPSASDCWAVGYYTPSTFLRRTLTEHWDGNAWTIVTSPNTSGASDDDVLTAVTCASASDCWAVGVYYDVNDNRQTITEHWNGTAWKVVPSPNNSETDDGLFGVTCASGSDCWAAGTYALIEHYSTSNQLGNISTRLKVETGGNVAIAGFITSGQPQKVLIRALGPTMAGPPFNVPGTLGDPKLVLYDQSQKPIATNDNWASTVIDGTVITEDQSDVIGNSIYRPSSPNESVIIATLPAGNYTAIVSGVNNTSGVALVEVYNLTSTSSGRLANISTRGLVQTGDNVMIGGFIISGVGSRTVVVRGLGPTLTGFGVAGALADPTLELHDGNGNLLASDDNWKDVQRTEIQVSGFAPPNDLEPAILATLPPANYTAIVRGKNNTIGVALVETYVTN